jgi:hypothetical protein
VVGAVSTTGASCLRRQDRPRGRERHLWSLPQKFAEGYTGLFLILAVPAAYARELTAITDVHTMSQRLREIMVNLLSELQHLPERSPIRTGWKVWKRTSSASNET